MHLERAIAYVQGQGNAIEQARMAALLWDQPPPPEALAALSALQHTDGGFGMWIPEVSSLCETATALQWLDDLKLYRGPLAEPACRFLLDRQQEDGGWDEVDAVRAYDPPEWMMPGRIETRVWLSAVCSHVLLRFGYAESAGTRCPAGFLLANSDENGRLRGYLRATWIALPMLAFYPGRDSEPFRQAMAVVEQDYSEAWPGSYTAWLLRCLRDAGVPAEHPLVSRSLDDLEGKQGPDGAWDAEDGQGFAVAATVEALRAFKCYGRI